MSDEEDVGSSLKVKSPPWRSMELTSFIRELDQRICAKEEQEAKQILRKKRVLAESPMKRLPSKKVSSICLESESDDED